MANASRDQNSVPTLLGVLNSDGQTKVPIKVIAATNALAVADGTTGSDNGPINDTRDQNSVPVLMAVSVVDGVTPVAVYADSNGNLLVDSTTT